MRASITIYVFILIALVIGSESIVVDLPIQPILPYGIEPYSDTGRCSISFNFRSEIMTSTLASCYVESPYNGCTVSSEPNLITKVIANVSSDTIIDPVYFNMKFVNATTLQTRLVLSDGKPYSYSCYSPPTTSTPEISMSPFRFLNTSYILSTSYFQTYLSLDNIYTRPLLRQYFSVSTKAFSISSVQYITPQKYLITFKYDPLITSLQPETISLNCGSDVIYFKNPVLLGDYPQIYKSSATTISRSNVPYYGNYLAVQLTNSSVNVLPVFSINLTPLFGKYPHNLNMYYRNMESEGAKYISGGQFTDLIGYNLNLPTLFTRNISLTRWSSTYFSLQIETTKSGGTFSNNHYRFSFYQDTLEIPVYYSYPFGLVSVDSIQRGYILPLSIRNLQKRLVFNFHSTVINATIDSTPDTTVPTLSAVQVVPLNETTSLLRLHVSDSPSGFYYAKINTMSRVFYVKSKDLASGTNFNGVYESFVPFKQSTSFNIALYNNVGNIRDYKNTDFYFDNSFSLPQPLTLITLFKKIKNVSFDKNTVSVSNSQTSCILYVSIDQTNTERENSNSLFVKTSLSPLIESKEIIGTYDPITQLYQFPIIIPQKIMPSYLNYSLFFNEQEIKGDTLVGLFGSNAQLYIDNTQDFDMMFPMIKGIALQILYTEASPTLVFTLMLDEPCKKLNIQIAGDYDVMGRNFTFENTKDVVLVKYPIEQSRCRPQYYYINYLYTEDLIGNKGEYIRGSSTNVDQFSGKVIPTFTEVDSEIFSQVSCPSTTIDTDAPMITSVAISQIPDPFKQLVQVLFTTYDAAPGISETNIPLCVFLDKSNEYLRTEAVYVSTNINGSINYQCLFDIPIGVGSDIILSIYGISDLHYNYIGYSSTDFVKAHLPYSFTFTPITNPVITSTSSLEHSSNKLIISGHNFIRPIGTCVVNIVYNSTKSDTLGVSIVTGSTIVLLNLPVAVNYTISVRDPTDEVSSNSVFLKGQISSTPTPEPVKCKSDCGASTGSGKCVNGVCVCNPPYNGLDCSSKTDNNTVITPDPNKPTVNVTIPGTSSGQTPEFTSFVSVVALRELDNTGTIINTHQFNSDKWMLVNEGSFSNEQVTTVQYKYITDDSFNTTIVSTVQVFAQATNITFGNQQLFMNPSTIKFTFNITSYPFSKSTNILQLVMNAALQSTEKVACSYKEFVDDQTNSQYLKLQIEDRSLFGRFIKFGMIDGREQVVTNTQLDNVYGGKELSTSTSDQSYIGLNIPYYTKYALLDPDFSVLIEQNTAREKDNSICTNESKKRLTNAQLAGIIVGGVVFLFILIATSIYFLSRTGTSSLAIKLRKIGKS